MKNFKNRKQNIYKIRIRIRIMEKTTIVLREDIKQALIREFGKRKISKVINDLLFKEIIIQKNRNMFGVDKWLTNKKIKEVRDHHDRF